MKALKLSLHVFTMEVRKFFSYRVDFWLQFIGSMASTVLVAYYLWKAVYEANQATELGGYSFQQMIFYYVLAPLIDRSVRGTDRGAFSEEIYDGSLTRYLLYPVSLLHYKYLGQLSNIAIGLIQMAIALCAYVAFFKIPYSQGLGPREFGLCFVGIMTAGLLYYLIMATLEMTAFWAENVWSLLVMLRFTVMFLGGAVVPLSLFPETLRQILKYTPFPYLISFHIRTLTGQVSTAEWLSGFTIAALWIVFFLILCRLILGSGLRRYTGVGI